MLPSNERIPMTKMQFYSELENLLEMDAGTIKGDEALLDLPGWDSMALLSFIAMVDSKLSLILSAGKLATCKSVPDLVNVCEGKVAD